MKVFVVEDSPLVRERLVAMLREIEAVEVVGESDNATEAVAGIVREAPAVVVLDIKLRGGSGMEVLEQIRKDAPDITTIMLTNFANDSYRQRYLAAGANFFFDKTEEFEKVRDVLERLVAADSSAPEIKASATCYEERES
jgi:DNA-binding NarL/FixJ family response regulator